MNDRNSKQYINEQKEDAGITTSSMDELGVDITPEATLFLPQATNQLNINPGDKIQNKSAQHLSPLVKQSSFWGGMRLRTKAIIAAIAIGTIPVVAIGATAYYFANQAVVKQIKQVQQDRAAQIANLVNRIMFERFGDIQVVANYAVFRDPKLAAVTSDREKQAILDRYIQAYGV